MEIMGMFDDSSHRAMTPCHGFPSWHIVAKRLQGLVRCDHHVTSKASPEILPNHHHFSKGVLWTITKMLGLWMFMALGCPQWTKVWALGCKSATLTCRNHLEPMDRCRPSDTSWTALPLVPSHCHGRPKSWECLCFSSPNWSGSEMHHWKMSMLVERKGNLILGKYDSFARITYWRAFLGELLLSEIRARLSMARLTFDGRRTAPDIVCI